MIQIVIRVLGSKRYEIMVDLYVITVRAEKFSSDEQVGRRLVEIMYER